ncbi:MAG: ABC transporter substrate-binding protein [Treponema sp.]|nr:ABC transporter substrate-binding protein [Treponema sp.]
MKRTGGIIAIVLSIILLVLFTSCPGDRGAQQADAVQGGATQINFGSTTQMVNWLHTGWPAGNNAVNNDIINLTRGHMSPIAFTRDEQWIINPQVVSNHTITNNPDGSRTYRIELHRDLRWSDGNPITAADFIGSTLMHNSPEWRELGAAATGGNRILGHPEFSAVRAAGDTAPRHFRGLRMYDNYTFSITIAATDASGNPNFPYFFEMTYIDVWPYPIHVWMPGVTVIDTPQGARLSDNYNIDLIRRSVDDPQTGQRWQPTVFSGPYVVTNFDTITSSAVLDLNPNFKALYDGHKPQIQRITVQHTPQPVQVDMFATDQVNFLAGIGGQNVDPLLDISEVANSGVSYATYLRAGYGHIHFRHDFSPTSRQPVRQAIAFIADREEFARQFTFGYGAVGHGMYGLAFQEYQRNSRTLYNRIIQYHFNPARATELLVGDGWTLNADGGPYVVGSGLPRHRRNAQGALEPLIINWFATVDNRVADLIAALIVPEAARVGIIINQTSGDFPTLQREMAARVTEYSMFNLATSWATPLFAPWDTFNPDDAYLGTSNTTYMNDPVLHGLAVALRTVPPGDTAEWDRRWLDFQVHWNAVLPQLPLYSDEYFDFHPANLANYNPTPFSAWRQSILWANLR